MNKEISRLKHAISQAVDEHSIRLIEISRFIHTNPELGFKEFKSSNILVNELEKNGFSVEKGSAGLPTAFKAHVEGKGAGPSIAFLAEYDALPEMGHACGHNIIAAAALGAALALKSLIKRINGNIFVIGTPAEEVGGGKIKLLDGGVFNGVDIALMIHPFNQTHAFLPSLAVKPIEFIFHGKAAHAAANPQEGIDALAAAIQTYNSINSLRELLPDDVRIHGIITDGGKATNIISDRAAIRYAVRTKNQDCLDKIIDKIINCAKGAAISSGSSLEIDQTGTMYSCLKRNKSIEKIVFHNFYLLSIDATPLEITSVNMASLDMGNVSHMIPSAHPFIAICDDHGLHTDEFCVASNTERSYAAMLKAAKLLAYIALDVILDEDLFNEIRKEHFINNR